MAAQRGQAEAFVGKALARVAREAQGMGDLADGVPFRPQAVEKLAKLGERERAGPTPLPDPLEDRV